MRAFWFAFGVTLAVSATVFATGSMSLVYPTVGSTAGPTWATMLNTMLLLVEEHDHTSGKGARITSAALNINATTEMNSNNLAEIKGLLFDNNASTQTGSRSVWVSGNELYYRNASSQNIQITSGTGLNGSATGGFSGNFVGNATGYYSSAQSMFAFYAANAASFDTSALAAGKFGKLWVGNNTASRDDFLWDASGTDVLTLGSDSNDDYTLNTSNIMNITTTGEIGFGAACQTSVLTTAGFTADFGVVRSSIAESVLQGTASARQYFVDSGTAANSLIGALQFNDGAFTLVQYNDAGTTKNTPLTVAATGGVTVGGAASGTELTVTGEAAVTTTLAVTGLITGTAGITTGAVSIVSATLTDSDTTPSVAGKSMFVTPANTIPTVITDLDDPAAANHRRHCGLDGVILLHGLWLGAGRRIGVGQAETHV